MQETCMTENFDCFGHKYIVPWLQRYDGTASVVKFHLFPVLFGHTMR